MSDRPHRPEGFQSITPYLSVPDAPALLSFLEQAFGATTVDRHDDGDRIAHAVIQIDGTLLELSTQGEGFPATPGAFHLYVEDIDAVHARALAAGATEVYPPADHDYGERGSGVRDQAGNHWWIATRL